MIDLRRITRTFPAQERKSPPLPVLSDITLRIPPGQYAAMVGASGSGKSTLMNILGCLDRPTSGVYRLHGGTFRLCRLTNWRRCAARKSGSCFRAFS